MSETQGQFDYSPGHLSAVEATMSGDRLQRYIAECGGDKEKGFRRYERNTLLSDAFYGPLQGVEIVTRNALHKQLVKMFGAGWFEEIDKQNILDPHRDPKTPVTLLKLRGAREYLRQKGKPETASRMAVELSFGFWVGICSSRYQATLWNPCLSRPFKGLGMTRAQIFSRLDGIRYLRNRIAHHEPILNRNLPDDYALIVSTVRMICGSTADWIEATSCFPERYGTPLASEQIADIPESDFANFEIAAELLELPPEGVARLAVCAAAKVSPAWGISTAPGERGEVSGTIDGALALNARNFQASDFRRLALRI